MKGILTILYKGDILNRLCKYDAAIRMYDLAIQLNPKLY